MLGKLPVPGRPTNLAYSRARAYCAFSRCGWGLFGHFSLIYHFSFLSPSLWETARYRRLKYCHKGPLSPKQPTNQTIIFPFFFFFFFHLFLYNTVLYGIIVLSVMEATFCLFNHYGDIIRDDFLLLFLFLLHMVVKHSRMSGAKLYRGDFTTLKILF